MDAKRKVFDNDWSSIDHLSVVMQRFIILCNFHFYRVRKLDDSSCKEVVEIVHTT